MPNFRIEKDFLGEVKVPDGALYGAQTQRALENFAISGIVFPRVFIRSLGLLKAVAAEVNMDLHLLEHHKAAAIHQAAEEVAAGRWDVHFPLDIFQTGSGTSTNMNANEVIAHRAMQILGVQPDSGKVHPNDHVNMGQSSNDIIPSAIHIGAVLLCTELLLPSLRHLAHALRIRAEENEGIVKTGRTHLMDAMPVRVSQEFGCWEYQTYQAVERIEQCLPRLSRLAVGGTAVGTGVNTSPEFGRLVSQKISEKTGIAFAEADNHFAAQSSMDAATELSSHLKTTASSMIKIANDIRLMNSGPLSGLAEITLAPLQPGSSIMPGKINPVVCEAFIMACVQVIGNDTAITIANSRGDFELNIMLPLIAHNLLQSITVLGNAVRFFADKAIANLSINRERMTSLLEMNPALVTRLTPILGYDKASEIAARAYKERRSVKELALEMTSLSLQELNRLLDAGSMT